MFSLFFKNIDWSTLFIQFIHINVDLKNKIWNIFSLHYTSYNIFNVWKKCNSKIYFNFGWAITVPYSFIKWNLKCLLFVMLFSAYLLCLKKKK